MHVFVCVWGSVLGAIAFLLHKYSPVLEIQPSGKKNLRRPSQVAEPGNLLVKQTLPLPFKTLCALRVYIKRLKRWEVREKRMELFICLRLGRRNGSHSYSQGIWRARACRITHVRRDHRRAPVKPLAESWVSPGVRPGYLGMRWVGSWKRARMEIAQPLWAIHQCLTACMVKIDCSRSGSYGTMFLMSSCSLKRERSNLFCNRNSLCEAWKTSGTRGLIHMKRNVKNGRKPKGASSYIPVLKCWCCSTKGLYL